jgi:hypothetical protein
MASGPPKISGQQREAPKAVYSAVNRQSLAADPQTVGSSVADDHNYGIYAEPFLFFVTFFTYK